MQWTVVSFAVVFDYFKMNSCNSFHSSDEILDYGYTLESPHRGDTYECPQSLFEDVYTPVDPSFITSSCFQKVFWIAIL